MTDTAKRELDVAQTTLARKLRREVNALEQEREEYARATRQWERASADAKRAIAELEAGLTALGVDPEDVIADIVVES